ncbi:MAG: IS21 family transposase [Spirochaetales bacterium]|nr:IS21 family transposase [Spirochaetales bacterium]
MLYAHQLKNQGYKQHQIAERLGVTDRTVRNYLSKPPSQQALRKARSSKLDPYKPFIVSILDNEPYYNGVILYERLIKQGYTGQISILRDYVTKARKKIITEAVLRFETEPGRQAQVDWKDYRRNGPDGKPEKLYAFVMIMGFSRKTFVMFTRSMKQSVLQYCHIAAFKYFGGIPHEILYDNMKTAFVCDPDGFWRPNKRLLSFATHYGFVPRRCQIRRPQTKGKVERAIGYLNTNFWPRVKNHIFGLDSLNEHVMKWLECIDKKELREFLETREERFAKERVYFKELPAQDYDCRETHEVWVSREARINYQTNCYSVPPEFIGERLTLKINPMNNLADLAVGKKIIRTMKLEVAGSHKLIETTEDMKALLELWEKQQSRRLKTQKRKSHKQEPQVDVRSPGSYDQFVKDEGVA